MIRNLIEAATALAGTLERENQALMLLDLARAAALLPEKRRAITAFNAAQACARQDTDLPPELRRTIADLTTRLRGLAIENRRLLGRGITAQARVIEVVAQAARIQHATTGSYRASGIVAGARTAAPLAISAAV
ncbi:conserved protein of unknown function [Rhodovastum atsumiense]|uniref:Flagellar protein FlgN n=1 Tax=Rhodovastum atsumiense TaxID=504468 RepID=A0A5M6J2J5_9PROT|nr:hypothetical protein [Rhodovastum atsumiense]KAA5614741.1 hypothetical protein F1189_01030 [Rhodovastum atsumiense]CAH2599716.1 conserved protein of unknown function [Rhodovastum atsumiense]